MAHMGLGGSGHMGTNAIFSAHSLDLLAKCICSLPILFWTIFLKEVVTLLAFQASWVILKIIFNVNKMPT